MKLAYDLFAAGLHVFPCSLDKNPAVPKGTPWQTVAAWSPNVSRWPSGIVGLPVPHGVVIVDLDTYKGITRQAVDAALGAALPWDQARIQVTLRGGQHYAFAVDWDVRQGSNLLGLEGFDTRTAGKGYICTGEGYTPVGFGPYAMAHPGALPRLPDACREHLEHVKRDPLERAELPEGNADLDTIRAALSHIDPARGRTDWLRVGLALRNATHEDPDAGLTLFDAWSAGEYSDDGAPGNYDGESIEGQWQSFKPDGDVTVATLFYDAMQGGWQPPETFDSALAFGPGAAPADVFADLVAAINESGSDSRAVEGLVARITAAGCNGLQVDLLRAELRAALKGAGLLDKKLGDRINAALETTAPGRPIALPEVRGIDGIEPRQLSRATGVHGANAMLALDEVFEGRLMAINDQLRWWSGREWEAVGDKAVETILWTALMPNESKNPNVMGTRNAIKRLTPTAQPRVTDRSVYFRNGVLEVLTGELHPHHRDNLNISTLQVDFNPQAQCPQWFTFLDSVFKGSPDGEDRVALLQEICGYLLMKDNLNLQKIIAFDGESRGGKGVILETMAEILGSAVGPVSFSGMGEGKMQSAFRNLDVAMDLEAIPPVGPFAREARGFMNKLASNEPVSIPLLHTQEPWTGRLNCKFIFACNGIPTMYDDSGGTTNRFMVLKFTRSFSEDEDTTILSRLIAEVEGVTLWSLNGLSRVLQNNGVFTVPATSVEAREDLKQENQPLREFINEYLVYDENGSVHSKEIWAAYRLWAQEANIKLPGRNTFLKSLRKTLGSEKVTRMGSLSIGGVTSTGYRGLRLSPDAIPFAPKLVEVTK